LSSCGPAGLRARLFPCEAAGLNLYLLVPETSDHLFNLEHEPLAVVNTPEWSLQGSAFALSLAEAPAGLSFVRLPEAIGCVLVEVRPYCLHINQPGGWGYSETLDIDQAPAGGHAGS
jgi:hypothetical protein